MRALQLQNPVKQSEVLGVGLKALSVMDDFALRAVLQAVPPLKTGRPKKNGAAQHDAAGSETRLQTLVRRFRQRAAPAQG